MARPFRVIDTGIRHCREQMAFDQALIETHKAGQIPDTLRVLQFPPSVLVGRHQAISHELNLEACRAAGVGIGRRITGFGLPQAELDAIVDAGIAFRTSGCPGKFAEDISACDRPYGDSPPSNIASYPFALQDVDIRKVRSQLAMDRPGERYEPGEEFETLDE